MCVSEGIEPPDRNVMSWYILRYILYAYEYIVVLLLYAFVYTNNLFYTSAHIVRCSYAAHGRGAGYTGEARVQWSLH